ncbi:oligosaccharide repeat unit polymerase [Pseudomonas sp. CCM 7891]|uniref:Oligosaccharide repeat unit polymerase n=1 Tax=Pseudomonas karstica TaxID=1055468 RepID=A0A7X2V0Z9_9PSED|nr:O-antigen polymerase [Pseudomonas karstica]MTD21792.1 oligosaccharide repeat unit polymerase [Pseudomonas karstica]
MDEFLIFKVINIFLAFLFLLGAWGARKIFSVWLNPVSILLLFWFFYTVFPLLAAFEAPVSPFAILYILSFCFAFSLSCFLFPWRTALARNENKLSADYYFNRPLMVGAFYGAAGFAVLMTFLGVLQQGVSIEQLLADPIAVGGVYAGKRYSGEIIPTIYAQLGLQCSYYTAVFGGLVYGSRGAAKGKLKLLLFAFLPALLVMFLQSAKGLLFFSVFLFLGSVLVTRIYNKNYTLLNYKGIRSLTLYGLLVFPLVIASFLSRGVYQLGDTALILNRLRFYLVTYSSVHLPAFSDWFSERYLGESLMNYKHDTLTMGFYTFMSLFQLAGDDRSVPMGIYDEYYAYGDFVKGNLFTVFRGLINDFGLLGSLFFAFVVGLFCNFGYWRLLCHRNSMFAVLFFVYFVAISYQTYIISSMSWLTIPLVFIVQWVLLLVLMKVRV